MNPHLRMDMRLATTAMRRGITQRRPLALASALVATGAGTVVGIAATEDELAPHMKHRQEGTRPARTLLISLAHF
jgi:hypothetical protein